MSQLRISFWIGFIVGLMGFVGGMVYSHTLQPRCPQEDSCIVEYYQGGWHIREVQP